MPDKQAAKEAGSKQEQKLRHIRDEFAYYRSYWRENYDEAAKDMDCMAGIPPKEFSDDRSGRPCIWPDETSQYIKQANNNLRQSKRSIKVSPRSEDATDKDAEHRQAYIYGIEYASKASSIYSTGHESATECGFGFWRIITKITGPKGEQEPRLKRIPNWATVYMDPDAMEADFSDMNGCFVLDRFRESIFKRKFPKAKRQSFTAEDRQVAPDWLQGDNIIVAEWWEREEKQAADGEKTYEVRQYLVNGIEFLHEADSEEDKDEDGIPCRKWLGSWIPIVPVIGEEIYVKEGGQSKRRIMSMIRRGRTAQQMMAYIASQEQEEFSQAPRAPYQGWKGTFDSEQHKTLHKDPRAYVEFNLPIDWPEAWGAPPMPTRNQYSPNIQAYEVAYERWRRSHQAAISGNPLPTDAQKVNDKSGIALEKIQDAGATGAFHFTDNFLRALHNTGLQVNELITKLAELDSLPKQILGRNKKDEDVRIRVVGKDFVPPESSEKLPEANYFFAHRGQFEVSVGDGPNKESEREEAAEFSDQIWELAAKMGLPPQITMKLLALATRMRNLGALGDEIAELLSPPDQANLPPQAQAMIAQLKGQLQEAMGEVQQLRLEKLGKVVEIQGKSALADKEFATRMSEADKDRETKLAVAEITTKAQSISERVAAVEDLMKQFHDQAHELALVMQQHQHAKELAAQSAATDSQAQASDQAHQAAMSAQTQEQPSAEATG
jgi:hypothetical protein